MSSPYVAEIRIFPFNFAPKGWAACNGQLLPISQNTALFSLLGTQYGGDGRSTFGLPNLQGSLAMHTTQYGSSPLGSYSIGETGGEASVTLLTTEIPQHQHGLNADTAVATSTTPVGAMPAEGVVGGSTATPLYNYTNTTPADTTLNPQAIGLTGASQPHNNMAPYLTLNFCIALQGIFPPRP